MLIEQANCLKERIEKLARLKAASEQAKTYETRAKQLSDSATTLSNSVARLKALQNAGIIIDFNHNGIAVLGEKAANLRRDFLADPISIGGASVNLKYEFLDRLKAIADAINSAAQEAWRRHVEIKSHTGSESVLRALSNLPAYQSAAGRIAACRTKILEIASSLPADVPDTLEQLEKLASDHKQAWEELTAGGIPEDVIAFLQACAGNGASLAMLSAVVRTWLDERDLANSFRIIPSGY